MPTRLTFDQLFQYSDPKRVARSADVKGPPLDIDSYRDTVYYCFNFKSNVTNTTGLRHRGYVRFFRPPSRKPVPLHQLKCMVDCTCFGPDTPVLMSDGTYKPISQIRDGDFVYTHTGRVRRVLGNVARKPKAGEKVYELKVTGFPTPVVVTEGHPYYALRGPRVCACGCGRALEPATSKLEHGTLRPEHLVERRYIKGHGTSERTQDAVIEGVLRAVEAGQPGSDIRQQYGISKGTLTNIRQGRLLPRPRPSDSSQFEWVRVGEFRSREWLLSPWLEAGRGGSLHPDIARFLGYYAADGCLHKGNTVAFAFHVEEEPTLVEDVRAIADNPEIAWSYFRVPRPHRGVQGETVRVYRGDQAHLRRPQKCLQVACHIQPEFRAFIEANVGRGSHSKCLSAWMMSLDNESLRQFVVGLFLGDGSFNKQGHFRWTSVSPKLVWGVSTILRRLRVDHVITPLGASGMAVDVNRGNAARTVHAWLCPYLREDIARRECLYEDKGGYSHAEGSLKTVKSRRELPRYTGEVWDLCVEEDHSFIVAGVAVANCPDYRYRWAWANKQRGSGTVGDQSLNQALNRAPRKTNPRAIPGLCKHILATREYIYGILSSFPNNQPDTSEKFDKLLKYARKRWDDWPSATVAAKQKQAQLRARSALRNVAGSVPTATAPVSAGSTPADPTPALPPELPPDLEPVPQTPQVPLAVDPGERGLGFPAPAAKGAPPPTPPSTPSSPTAAAPPKGKTDSRGFPTVAQMRAARYGESQRVFSTNGETTMSDLKQALRIVEELEDEASSTFLNAGGATDSGEYAAPDLPPSEPPVSDSALGADTEGESALSLLRQMRDSLQQLATALAPPPDTGEGGLEGAAGPGGPALGGLPDEGLSDLGAGSEGGTGPDELAVPEVSDGAEDFEGVDDDGPDDGAEDEAEAADDGEDEDEPPNRRPVE